MSTHEQQEVREKHYHEAIRYMDNAKETLKKARKEDDYYTDRKYVRTACGTAYNGVLIALDGYLLTKGVEPPKKSRRSITYYESNIAKLDRKLLRHLDVAYDVLHLSGYYDGIQDAAIIKRGLDVAYAIIDHVKPMQHA